MSRLPKTEPRDEREPWDSHERVRAAVPAPDPSSRWRDLGKYRLLVELGRGGMGVVYLSVLRGAGGFRKLLVLKELREECLNDDMVVTMFLDEARLAARLNHPNIVQTLEVGGEGRRRFIAMEYIEGQTLSRVLARARKRGTRVAPEVHLRVILDVLVALEYAHTLRDFDGGCLGVVHRDVSPGNVLITYEGQTKLVDFGIAKTLLPAEGTAPISHERDRAPSPTHAKLITGKVRYMSPEQATGAHVDGRADVFAVGVMLWEAIVGRRPWDGLSTEVVLQSLRFGAVPRLREACSDLDPQLAEIVDRAMAADRDARYPSARAMREDLEGYVGTRRAAPVSNRGLAALVSDLFGSDRMMLQEVVDAQLRRSDSDGMNLPSNVSMQRTMMDFTPKSAVHSVSPRDMDDSTPRSPLRASKPAPLSRKGVLVLGGGAVFAVAIVTTIVVARSAALRSAAILPDSPPPATARAAALLPLSTAERAPTPTSHVVVRASPPEARISVDDVVVPNPYVIDHVRDGVPHQLRATAPGYGMRTWALSYDSDLYMDLALAREAPPRPLERRAFPRSQTAPQPTTVEAPPLPPQPTRMEAPATKPARPIQRDNPYAPPESGGRP
jgi:serine/threonine protein kinase